MEENFKLILAKRYLDNTLTADELEVFFHLVQTGEMDSYLTKALEAHRHLMVVEKTIVVPIAKKKSVQKIWLPAAALILLMLSAVIYFTYKNQTAKTADPVIAATDGRYKNDVLPGSTKAILTLADGRTIKLDSTDSGTITGDGGMVMEYKNGQLVYDHNTIPPNAVLYNQVNTYNGGQYVITLSDGTKAWLNAASSLRFPAVFMGNERNVEITGEVYFEVAKNEMAPFTVSMGNNEQVQVLGTRFNIHLYPESATRNITLLEGVVKINAGSKVVQLQPGQQARISTNHEMDVVNNVNLEAVMAWKNGYFLLNADIKEIMLQVKRWYNVEVIYKGNMPSEELRGKIARNEPLSKLLQILELTGLVRFTIEGRVVTVMP